MFDEKLFEVLTINEVAYMWKRHPLTVRRAINSLYKPLAARKSPDTVNGIWLISYRSCVKRWGEPERLS